MLLEVKESTGITPKALLNRPLPRADCTKYREIFQLLSGQREFSDVGAQAIPVSEIVSYCLGVGIYDPAEREKVIRFTTSLDAVFRDHLREKMDKEAAERKH